MSTRAKFPWYKERLETKYSKDVNPILHHKNWTFVKFGLDDFRDGFPPPEDEILVYPKRGPSPILLNHFSATEKRKVSRSLNAHTKYLSTHEKLFSTKIPAVERKQFRVMQLEENLLAHPLALFPDLENGLNPELYEEIVDILDPDLLDMIESDDESTESMEESPEDSITSPSDSVTLPKLDYAKMLRKSRNQGNAKKTAELEQHEKKIKNIAKEFCKWSESLGEGGPCLEPETVEALFASGYSQAKQFSGPVHIVDPGLIPAELRDKKSSIATPPTQEKLANMNKPSVQSRSYRYGAWYLEPETWKRMERTEPLVDPEEKIKEENSKAKVQIRNLHSQLAPLHGAKAFRAYLEKNGRKKPDFMNDISKIQDEAEDKH